MSTIIRRFMIPEPKNSTWFKRD